MKKERLPRKAKKRVKKIRLKLNEIIKRLENNKTFINGRN